MIIAGTHLTENDIVALTDMLRHNGCSDEAGRLMEAYWQDTHLFHLTPDARTAIKNVLDDRPNELPLLRANLRDQN